MKKARYLFLFIFLLVSYFSMAQDMDNRKMGQILESISDTIAGDKGQWQFMYKEMLMLCLTDETHNRMRIITPVTELAKVGEGEVEACLEANFHTALDVKYAISEGMIWVVFIHPLAELTERQLKDAISQVFFATITFGSSYSSTDLVFPGGKEELRKNE